MENQPITNTRLAFFQGLIGQPMTNSPSPVGRWLGGILRQAEDQKMAVEFTVTEAMTNPMGGLHGGTAAAMMDDTIGIMVFMMGREYAYTSVNLNCDFLTTATVGDVITAQAVVIRAGRNVIHCECHLIKQDGKIVAKSSSNMIQTPIKLTF
jgi:acyl-coenzyme A thioesterase 13